MKGLVIVTHSVLSKGLLMAAEAILGPVDKAEAICLQKEDSVERINTKIRDGIAAAGEATDGVIVMADMFGGTPCNISLAYLQNGRIEVVTGVNLPMVLKFFQNRRESSLTRLAADIREAGREGITVPGDFLRSQVSMGSAGENSAARNRE
ncbi:MAG: PTS sugar transporter subunit IIA [Deltaproteobacteria bacterium]|nr:PTS sugar transporter subunit IIA [Deltaproteobacteria bacterium]